MINIFGWLGMIFIICAFGILNTKYYKLFVPLDALATLLFLTHAFIINDLPFILMNGFILVMLLWKWVKGGLK